MSTTVLGELAAILRRNGWVVTPPFDVAAGDVVRVHVMGLAEALGAGFTRYEVREATKCSLAKADDVLSQLAREGLLVRVSWGRYALPSCAEAQRKGIKARKAGLLK